MVERTFILQPAGRIEVDDAALEIDLRMHRQLGDGLRNRSAQPKTTAPHSDSTKERRRPLVRFRGEGAMD